MTDEAERIPRIRFPETSRTTPARLPPRPTGTLEQILSRIAAATPQDRLDGDLTRIERALSRLEQAMREAMRDDQR